MDQADDRPGASAPQDGAMEFSGYSDAQLRDLRAHIDQARFPRNYEKLEAEIARREGGTQGRRFPVRFTAADGLAGWLQALAARQAFYGAGGITPGREEILIEGWQRTWLGVAQQSEAGIAADRIRNVYSDQEWVSFDVCRRFWWPRHYMVRSTDASVAATLVGLLPTARSKWFEKQATDIRGFYRLQREPSRRPLVTPLLVVISIGLYLIQASISGYWWQLDGGTLFNWGANAGSFTVHGGWWRLVAALFLHLNILHLVVNMWVLWSTGRLVERLFGNVAFAAVYFAAGIMGGLLSIGWNPAGVSVGASGAIFGVLGAFVSYLLHGGTRIPQPVMRAHLLPTVLFTLFSVLNGLSQTGIDNAAHLGGLVTGLLLGWALAKPLDGQVEGSRKVQSAAAILLVVLAAAGLLFQVTGPASRLGPEEQFLASHEWYRAGETKNLLHWQEVATQVAAGTIASADLEQKFDREIVPFWGDAEPRLQQEIPHASPQRRPFLEAVTDFASLRLRWARAIIESAKSNNGQSAIELMQKTDVAQARLDWFTLRSQYDHKAASLAENPVITWISDDAWLNYRPCTKYPYQDINSVAPSDLASDGPARRLALGCEAQHLFLTRDFKGLDAALEAAGRHLGDLPDGGSGYEGLTAGLDNLIDYGGLSLDDVMGRLASWRGTVPSSVYADLVEAEALVSWAYNARGTGYADSVTAQSQMIFLHRINIADAALQTLEPRALNYPLWYASAINVNLLGNGKEEERRAIFDRAHARFPDNLEIDHAMLHSLMPRWGGSFEKVAKFIVEQARQISAGMPPNEKYSRLYWMYAGLEGKDTDIFKDVYAKPELVTLGIAIAEKRFPNSDYLANVDGRLACQTGDRVEYLVFKDSMPKHYSASAWSSDFSVDSCNKKFDLKP